MAGTLAFAISCGPKTTETANPFLTEYPNEFDIPDFANIKYEHYIPAIKAGIEAHNQEIDSILNNPDEANFENTILALDNAGQLLNKVSTVLFALNSSDNTDEMQKITEEAQPLITAHSDEVALNKKLFERIKQVYDKKAELNLNTAQERLLYDYYKNLVRSGALLTDQQQDTLRQINQRLAALELSFGNNVLKDINATEVVVDSEEELAGLDAAIIEDAAAEAKNRGKEGKWVFTVNSTNRLSILTNAENRGLREPILPFAATAMSLTTPKTSTNSCASAKRRPRCSVSTTLPLI